MDAVDSFAASENPADIDEVDMAVTEALARWSSTLPPIVEGRAVALARSALIDVIACMVAGADDPSAERVRTTLAPWAKGGVTVAGSKLRLPAPWAALANGTAAHALDYDDNFLPGTTHATAVLIPALLALGEEIGAGGRELLDAYIVGLELHARLGQGMNAAHYAKGWHATSTVGAIGSAGACARLLRLDAARTRTALSLATSMASGSKRQFGTMAKPLHAGLAAQAAVMAATLAQNGMSAAPEAIDGEMGIRDLMAGPASPGFDKPLNRLGRPLAILENGLAAKRFPCCGSAHRSLDGLLDLRAKHRLATADVERIETVVSPINMKNLMYPEPRDETEGKFSMQYCMAAIMAQGRLGLGDFVPGAVHRPEVRAWFPRIVMRAHDLPIDAPIDDGRPPAVVRVTLAGGETFETEVRHARGTLENPLSADELAEKFRDCTAGWMPRQWADSLLGMLNEVDRLPSIVPLARALARPDEARP